MAKIGVIDIQRLFYEQYNIISDERLNKPLSIVCDPLTFSTIKFWLGSFNPNLTYPINIYGIPVCVDEQAQVDTFLILNT